MSRGDNLDRVDPVPQIRSWKRRLLRSLFLFVVVPYVAIVVMVTVFQRRLIYQPTQTEPLLAQKATTSDVDVEDVEIHAANGLALHGWRFHAESAAEIEQKFLVIYFPGNAGCRRDRFADCRDFTRLGCDVVLFDYRGYGDNGGSPSEALLAVDARRVWMFATHILQFPPGRILLFGESLGGAVATRLGAEFSLAGDPPAALILNSTFASLGQTAAWHYPALPVQYLLLDRFPSVERIPYLTCPVLQFHGTADDIIPFEHGRRLFDAAPSTSATGIASRFVTIQDGQHNFISMADMRDAVKELLTQLRGRPGRVPEAANTIEP